MSQLDPSRLSSHEVAIVLSALSDKYGFGYSKNLVIGRLQAKLSIMAEVRAKLGDTSHKQPVPEPEHD